MGMTIGTVADLIHEFVSAEKELLNQKDIKHPTTIGAMYEGLTAEILGRSVFGGLDLRVARNSFIAGCATEFDVLLVEGAGEAVPYTDRFVFRPAQVIAIVEVKKNLYARDIAEGYDNLRLLFNHFEGIAGRHVGSMFRDSYRQICRKDVAVVDPDALSETEEGIYYALRAESQLPVRIIWGYNGFSSESSFRDAVSGYLFGKVSTGLDNMIAGYGPHNLPSLIICGNYAVFKNNALPFTLPMEDDRRWPIYVSSSRNPAYILLEMIWTRLAYRYGLPKEIFSGAMERQPVSRFLDCRVWSNDGLKGWQYGSTVISEEGLRKNMQV